MKNSWPLSLKTRFTKPFFLMALVLTWTGCSDDSENLGKQSVDASGKKVTEVSALGVACAGSTESSIYLTVTAGATGAPAGFSVQWISADSLAANGGVWYASTDSRLCKASFSGNAFGSRYELAAGQSMTVNIGEMLFDNGASSNCIGELMCGTNYVFRVFGHATKTLTKSPLTTQSCSTLVCQVDGDGCTNGQGYWKTHGPSPCDPSSTNPNEWPVTTLTLGNTSYTEAELCTIYTTSAGGQDKTIALQHQLISAKLNIASGASDVDIAAAITAADEWLINGGSIGNLITDLTNYNEGATGPGQCDN
jgi:hypothetical protein